MRSFNLPLNLIPRKREIKEISNGLTKYGTVLLIGVAGIGKTVLARHYANINPLNFKEIHLFSGIELEFNDSKIVLFYFALESVKERLIIIDGYDEILSMKTKENINKVVEDGKKYGTKLLITSREPVNDNFINNNSYQVTLNGWDKNQVIQFLKGNLKRMDLNTDYIQYYEKFANNLNYNPLLLNYFLELIQKENITPKELLTLISDKLHYENKIFTPETTKKIVAPGTPKIISDVRLINISLIEKVHRNPKMMFQMTSRQFEELVAELFEKDGYSVRITQATRDGGKDLVILEQKRIGNFIIYVECKNYSMENPIGVRLVRELYGTVIADRATMGILATSSYFSTPAIEFKEQVKSQLSLCDYFDLKKWIDEKANKDFI